MRAFDRVARSLAATALVVGMVVGASGPARAAFHLMKIVEVFAGTGDFANAEYVELQMYSGGQNFVAGHHLRIYNASGAEVGDFIFPSPAANGSNQDSILVGTTSVGTLFGVTPDLSMGASEVIPAAGGKACFDTIDCVSWGSYSGDNAGSGSPARPGRGIVSGAALVRDISAGNASQLEDADDSNSSAADFDYGIPAPRNNARVTGTSSGGVLTMGAQTADEGAGTANVNITRTGGSGTVSVQYATGGGTAEEGYDYAAWSGTASFNEGVTTQPVPVAITDDSADEPDESLVITLASPTGGATLGTVDTTVTIADNDGGGGGGGDTTKPASRVTKPAQGRTYLRGRLRRLTGTAADDSGTVALVQIALRQKRKDGTCRWWTGGRFVRRACSVKAWRAASGGATWSYMVGSPLPVSTRASKIVNYTAYSRATDGSSNVEDAFERGRNSNTFEIK